MKVIKRIINVIKCWLNSKSVVLEENNLQVLVDNLTEEKSKAIMDIFNKLVDIDTSIKQLKRTKENIAKEVDNYETLTKKALGNDDKAQAERYAIEYENHKIQLDKLTEGLERAESYYSELTQKQSDVVSRFDQRISDIKIKMTNYRISEQLNSIRQISGIERDDTFDKKITRIGDIIDKKNDHLESETSVAEKLNLMDESAPAESFEERRKNALDKFKSTHNI